MDDFVLVDVKFETVDVKEECEGKGDALTIASNITNGS